MKEKILISLAVFFFVSVSMVSAVSAASYYIDFQNGNDSNDGLSQTTAWKTTTKVSNSNFLPGDFILFKRGQTWKDKLIIPSSGNSNAPITFGAYSEGEKPIISGELLPHPERTVYLSGKSYVTLENLHIIYNNCTWCGVFEARDSDHVILRNCEIHEALTYAVIYWLRTHDGLIEDCHIYGNRGNDSYGSVLMLENSNRNVIRNSTIHDTAASMADVISLSNSSDNVVEGNDVYGPAENGIYVRPGSRNTLRYNYIHNISGIGIQLRDNARDNSVYYNILLHNDGPTIQSDGKNGAGASGNKIYNNIVYNDGDARGIHIMAVAGQNYGTEVKNNIIISENENVIMVDEDSRDSGIMVDYNCYWKRNSLHAPFLASDVVWTPYYDLNSWSSATGLDLHSVFVNPLLKQDPPINPESIMLQAMSPCINAGVDVGLMRDYFGTFVPQGAGWDIGAYEYSGAQAYYVSKSGSNSPACISSPGPDSKACLTIMYVINNAQLKGRDTVYIQAGTYSEAVTVTASDQGSDGNYVTFKSYGNDDVIITPANGYTPLSIWNNWDGGINTTRYIKWDGSGNDNGRHITFIAGAAWQVVVLRNVQYIWLKGLKIDGSNHTDYNIYMLSYHLGTDNNQTDDNKGPKNCIIENVESYGAMDYGLKLTGWGTDNNIIRNSSFHHNAVYGISISGNGYNNNPPADNEIYDNEIYANGQHGLAIVNTGGGGHNGEKIYRNIVRNNGLSGIGLGSDGNRNEIYSNSIYSNNYYGIGTGGVTAGSNYNLIYNNVIYNNAAADGNVIFQAGSANNEFYSNSVSVPENLNTYGIYLKFSAGSGNIIRNNIVYTSGTGYRGRYAFRIDINNQTALDNLEVRNNCFKSLADDRPVYYSDNGHTVAEMNSQAWASGNIDENPGWDSNFRLTSSTQSGPDHIRDGGQDLPSKFAVDKDGVSRPQGSAWDMGAYEFVPSACLHKSDSNCNGCVSDTELTAFIDQWKADSSNPTLKELIEAIGLWKRGC